MKSVFIVTLLQALFLHLAWCQLENPEKIMCDTDAKLQDLISKLTPDGQLVVETILKQVNFELITGMRNIACKKKTLNFTTEEIKERKAHALIKKLGKYSGCSLLNSTLTEALPVGYCERFREFKNVTNSFNEKKKKHVLNYLKDLAKSAASIRTKAFNDRVTGLKEHLKDEKQDIVEEIIATFGNYSKADLMI